MEWMAPSSAISCISPSVGPQLVMISALDAIMLRGCKEIPAIRVFQVLEWKMMRGELLKPGVDVEMGG